MNGEIMYLKMLNVFSNNFDRRLYKSHASDMPNQHRNQPVRSLKGHHQIAKEAFLIHTNYKP